MSRNTKKVSKIQKDSKIQESVNKKKVKNTRKCQQKQSKIQKKVKRNALKNEGKVKMSRPSFPR